MTNELNRVKKSFLAVCLIIMIMGLTACGSESATPTPVPTAVANPTAAATPTTAPPPLSPAEMLTKASAAFAELQSYYLTLDIRQGKLQVKGLDVKQAEGSLQAPDRYDVKVKVGFLIVDFSVPVIGLDGQQYMRDDSRNWKESGPDEKLDLPGLFDRQSGVGPTLAKVRDLRYLGTESLNGVSTYHLQGSLTGTDIRLLTLEKLGTKDVTVDLWLDTATYRLTRLDLKETGQEAAYWVYTFSKYNEPVNIQKPGK